MFPFYLIQCQIYYYYIHTMYCTSTRKGQNLLLLWLERLIYHVIYLYTSGYSPSFLPERACG